MAKKKKIVEVIQLVCKETGDQNYTIRRKRGENKLEIKKFASFAQTHSAC